MNTLAQFLPTLSRTLPVLLQARGAAPLLAPIPDPDSPLLHHGLLAENGSLTRKGVRALEHLQTLADTLGLPLL